MISQQEYIKELLKRFEMESSKTIDTLIVTTTCLDMDEHGSPVNKTMYRGIIGSLLYLTASRPDIVFSVGWCVASGVSKTPSSHGFDLNIASTSRNAISSFTDTTLLGIIMGKIGENILTVVAMERLVGDSLSDDVGTGTQGEE
ncbi:uncharacterized protein [Nicotiana tomentosiformis]|uniref:uncharacterized protein n=1 Tax=Nicotiana tomentosiformis TaxID=4098 RepID=UPI00388C86AF